MIAPNWEMCNDIYIDISGRNARARASAQAKRKDGKPGFPGGNAGNFYGIGINFNNGKISFNLNGGKGGDGQNGADWI